MLLVEQLCQNESSHGTVGTPTKLSVEPNAMNTVPGVHDFSNEIVSSAALAVRFHVFVTA